MGTGLIGMEDSHLEHSQTQSTHKNGPLADTEHLWVKNTHRFAALTDMEHSWMQSTHRYGALTDAEHSQVRNTYGHRVWNTQTMFVGLFHMLCTKNHLSTIQHPGFHPLLSMETVSCNSVLFL